MIKYPARVIEEENGGYSLEFIDFPSCLTEGETKSQLIENAQDALSLVLGFRLEENREIPLPSNIEDEDIILINPDYHIQIPLTLKFLRKSLKLTQKEVAEKLEVSYQTYQKIERCKRFPTIKTLEKVANALGKELVIDLR